MFTRLNGYLSVLYIGTVFKQPPKRPKRLRLGYSVKERSCCMAIFEKTMAENVVARRQRNPYANVQRWDSQGRGSAIVGMTRIWERLYLGSIRDAAQLAAENPFGITAILSLCSRKVPKRASRINYTRIPIVESCPISAREFEAVMGGNIARRPTRNSTDPLCRRHTSLTSHDGCMAAPMRMPQPRCGAS